MFAFSTPFNMTKRIVAAVMCLCILTVVFGWLVDVHSAKAAEVCNDGGSISMGRYWLNSNQWGAKSGTGSQCVWGVSNAASSIAWGTIWKWSGGANSVKTYDSSVLGWQWGWKNSNTGLPIQLSSNQGIKTGWKYHLTQNGANTLDIAYDLWLHTMPNAAYNSTPSDEIMIWLAKEGGAGPVGTKQATVTVDGVNWDIYEGNIGWEVYSFVRTTNTSSSTLDLKDFLNYLISRGLSSSKYLSGVQAGTEIFTGNGELDTTSYYAHVVTEGDGGENFPAPTPTPATDSGGFTPIPGTRYHIVNRNSGQLLDIASASISNGGLADQWPNDSQANQEWTFEAINGGYKIVSVNSGLLLDDLGGSTTEGKQLDQWNDTNGSNQWWNIVSDGGGYYSLVNQSSHLYVDVKNDSRADGAKVLQWPSDGGANQQWQFVAV